MKVSLQLQLKARVSPCPLGLTDLPYRDWEAEVGRLVHAGLDEDGLLGVDMSSKGHMTKRVRQYHSPTVVSSLESST